MRAVNSSMGEAVSAGTRGGCLIISEANIRLKWTLTLGLLKKDRKKYGTRLIKEKELVSTGGRTKDFARLFIFKIVL